MCSVCKLEGNHMKRSQTKSLLCSNWPPSHPHPSSASIARGRGSVRESERERERERGKKGEVCVQTRRNWKGAVHTLAASHGQTHRSTGELQKKRKKNPNKKGGESWNFICRCEPVAAADFVTCSTLCLSVRGKTLSLFGEGERKKRGSEGGSEAVNWSRGEEGNFWKSLFE